MREFTLSADLAAGLTHRLQQLDPQKVSDTLGGKPTASIRKLRKVTSEIEKANAAFMEAAAATGKIHQANFDEMKKKYQEQSAGKSAEEGHVILSRLRAEYDAKAAEVNRSSEAKPREKVTVSLGNDDFVKVLMPLFELTAATWADAEGNNSQKYFLEVADALEGIAPAEAEAAATDAKTDDSEKEKQ